MRDLYNTINKPLHITKKEERKGVNLLKTISLNRLDNKLTKRGAKSGYTNKPYTHREKETKGSINIERERERESACTLLHFDHKMRHILHTVTGTCKETQKYTPLFSSCMTKSDNLE